MLKIEPAFAIFAGDKVITMVYADACDLYTELHQIFGDIVTPEIDVSCPQSAVTGAVVHPQEHGDAADDASCANCKALESQVRNLQRNLAAADTENSQLHEQNAQLRADLNRKDVS